MKQDFTQQQWEHLLLAQKEYTIAKATGDPSENDKLNALINAFAITEDYDQQDLEAKMADLLDCLCRLRSPQWITIKHD
jgi:hypothetical protein